MISKINDTKRAITSVLDAMDGSTGEDKAVYMTRLRVLYNRLSGLEKSVERKQVSSPEAFKQTPTMCSGSSRDMSAKIFAQENGYDEEYDFFSHTLSEHEEESVYECEYDDDYGNVGEVVSVERGVLGLALALASVSCGDIHRGLTMLHANLAFADGACSTVASALANAINYGDATDIMHVQLLARDCLDRVSACLSEEETMRLESILKEVLM